MRLTHAHTTARRLQRFLLAALFVSIAPPPAAAQISVDQAEIALEPGRREAASFNVANESGETIQATVYAGDWDRDADGNNRFLASGTLPSSCGARLRIFPLTLRLPPGTSQTVRIGLLPADTLRAACWSIVFVESGRPTSNPGRSISYVTRLGVKVYIVPATASADGQVADLTVRARTRPVGAKAPADSATRELVVSFRNTGGRPLHTRGSVEFRRLDNSVAAKVDVDDFPTLPGSERRVVVPVPPLPPGQYVVLALLDYGGAEVAAGQIELEEP